MSQEPAKPDSLEPMSLDEVLRLQERAPDRVLTPREYVRLLKAFERREMDTLT